MLLATHRGSFDVAGMTSLRFKRVRLPRRIEVPRPSTRAWGQRQNLTDRTLAERVRSIPDPRLLGINVPGHHGCARKVAGRTLLQHSRLHEAGQVVIGVVRRPVEGVM